MNVTTLGSPGDAFVEACLQAISATIDFFASEYAVDLSAIEVTIGGDLDTFVEAIASARELDGEMADRSALREELRDVGGTVFNDAIFVYHPRSRDDELDAIRWVWEAIPHEATHIMQKRLSGKSAERDWARFLLFIPRWYTEGHADFVGAVVSSRYAPPVFGVGLEVARFRAQLVSDAGSKTLVDVDKDDLGARRVSADDYALGFLAVDLLAGEDVTGHRLLSVWEAFNDHEAYWARAFETSFAMTVEDFYESFERARSTLER